MVEFFGAVLLALLVSLFPVLASVIVPRACRIVAVVAILVVRHRRAKQKWMERPSTRHEPIASR